MANNDSSSVSQCACGQWFNNHESGKCKTCRQRNSAKRHTRTHRRRDTRRPVWGTQEWAETRGDDIPGGDY